MYHICFLQRCRNCICFVIFLNYDFTIMFINAKITAVAIVSQYSSYFNIIGNCSILDIEIM